MSEGKHVRSFFSLRAARDIAAGEQVLHTYGDLSDSALLQVRPH